MPHQWFAIVMGPRLFDHAGTFTRNINSLRRGKCKYAEYPASAWTRFAEGGVPLTDVPVGRLVYIAMQARRSLLFYEAAMRRSA